MRYLSPAPRFASSWPRPLLRPAACDQRGPPSRVFRDFSRMGSLAIFGRRPSACSYAPSSLQGVAMSSIGAKLLDNLRSVERPGDFCVGGIREVLMPAIDVDGVGRIAFPILPAQAETLVAIAEAAPYGPGEETVVDRDVRRTWQVDSAKVRIGGRHWEKTLGELVAGVAAGLGVSGPLAADFYKLLV
jgi:hypothetical protein